MANALEVTPSEGGAQKDDFLVCGWKRACLSLYLSSHAHAATLGEIFICRNNPGVRFAPRAGAISTPAANKNNETRDTPRWNLDQPTVSLACW